MTKPMCYHQDKRVVWTDVNTTAEKLAVRQLRHQCVDCGRLLANALPFSLATPATPNVDMELLQRWAAFDKEQWGRHRQENQLLSERRKQEQKLAHDQYLQSDAWRDKRAAVMDRANGLCEGCRQRPATQVHHLTYAHHGNELLWELVAVCRGCHEHAHNLR